MPDLYKGIECKPYLISLNQIEVFQKDSGTSVCMLEKISSSWKNEFNCNFALPLVCLTDREDTYHLLTGLAIYEAAKLANIEQIWVFIIAAQQTVIGKAIEQVTLQSKLNQRVIEPSDVEDFLSFLNNSDKSTLMSIPGIKDGYAKLILDNRKYDSLEDLKHRLGVKRTLKWLKAYKEPKI